MHVRLRQSESEVKVIWLSVSVLNFYLCPSRLFFLRLWGTNSDLHPDSKISAQFPGADVRSFQDFERFNDCYWAYRNFDESKVWFSPGWPMWWRQRVSWFSIILSFVPSFFKLWSSNLDKKRLRKRKKVQNFVWDVTVQSQRFFIWTQKRDTRGWKNSKTGNLPVKNFHKSSQILLKTRFFIFCPNEVSTKPFRQWFLDLGGEIFTDCLTTRDFIKPVF